MRGGLAIGLIGVTLLAGCSSNNEESATPQPAAVACTMIGCSNGLRVLVEGSVPERFNVEVRGAGRTLRTVACTAAAACDVFIDNETPTEVEIRITWGDDHDREWTVTPTYRDVQPNGPACPPTCRQGTVAITV